MRYCIFFAILFSCKTSLFSQSVQLVRDINSFTDANPSNLNSGARAESFAILNGVAYFTTSNPKGIWRSDGTKAGTYLLKPGVSSSLIVKAADKLFFTDENNSNLWVSDGTETGTHTIFENKPAEISSFSQTLFSIGGKVLFLVNGSGGSSDQLDRLWVSDGTPAGTKLVKNFAGVGIFVRGMRVIQNRLYFSAYTFGQNLDVQMRLWVSDGTAAGTYQVGTNVIDPGEVTETDAGEIYFTGIAPGTNNYRLWEVDKATNTAVERVGELRGLVINQSTGIASLDGYVYFSAMTSATSDSKGIYRYNTTDNGTIETVKSAGANSGTGLIEKIDTAIYFTFYNNSSKYQLWQASGNLLDTVQVKDSVANSGIAIVGESIYFTGYEKLTGYELWGYNRKTKHAALVADIFLGEGSAGIISLSPFDNRLMFGANDGIHGNELWITQGNQSGATLVKDINTEVSSSASPVAFSSFKNQLLFGADNGTGKGRRIYKSDGTAAGTVLVNDKIMPDQAPFAVIGNNAYFIGITADSIGIGFFKTDGTNEGTVLVKKLPTSIYSTSRYFVADTLVYFFFRSSQVPGLVLWRSDGTAEGTFPIKTDLGNIDVTCATMGDNLFFTSADGQFWRTNGSAAGTLLLRQFSTRPGFMTPYRGQLYFSFFNSNSAIDFGTWRSDGTVAGTQQFANDDAGSFTVSGGQLFCSSSGNGSDGRELCLLDTTTNKFKLVKDIRPSVNSSDPKYLIDMKGVLLFWAWDGNDKHILWRSDGTEIGTNMVAYVDYNFGFNDLIVADSILYLFNDKNELWRTDGTAAGTFKVPNNDSSGFVFNISATNYSSYFNRGWQNPMATIGDKLFFSASAENTGYELYGVMGKKLVFCPSGGTDNLYTDIIGSSYQWQLDKGDGFVDIADTTIYTGVNTGTLVLNNLPSKYNGYKFRCKVSDRYSEEHTVFFRSYWNGLRSYDWHNPLNWDCGVVPDENTDVIVGSGPIQISTYVNVRSLKVAKGVYFMLLPGGDLNITGSTK